MKTSYIQPVRNLLLCSTTSLHYYHCILAGGPAYVRELIYPLISFTVSNETSGLTIAIVGSYKLDKEHSIDGILGLVSGVPL
jgi:hypothetical protein